MAGQVFLDRLKKTFGAGVVGANLEAMDPWIEIAPEALVEVARYLRDQPDAQFQMLNCITVVDYFQADPKKANKLTQPPRLEVVYHLSSVTKKHSLVLKVTLPRWKDDVVGQLPELPSLCVVWNAADWHEREVYDLSGVRFIGHPDMRRILCPEDWVGHPLRKDYEMPLEYHGIRGR